MKNFKINKENILYCMKILSIGGAISFALVGSFAGGYYYRKVQEEKSNSIPTNVDISYYYSEYELKGEKWVKSEPAKEYKIPPKDTKEKHYVFEGTDYKYFK